MTIFSQVARKIRSKGYSSLSKGSSRPFSVEFVGEGAEDAGGPMRDVLSNMVDELMSCDVLPIFVPTANNVANVDPCIDCVRLNQNATEPHVLQNILFCGYFIGWSIVALGNMSFTLPDAFWRRITGGGEDYVYTLEDLKSMDLFRYNQLCQLREHSQTLSDEDFEGFYMGETFEADLDGTDLYPLCKDGDQI